MPYFNKILLMGHCGTPPELRTTQTGKSVANFTMATSEGSKDNKTTTWHTVVLWNQSAEYGCKYIKKGSLVHVEGRLQVREYEDKQGNKRKAYEVVANNVQVMKALSSDSNEDDQFVEVQHSFSNFGEEDVPF